MAPSPFLLGATINHHLDRHSDDEIANFTLTTFYQAWNSPTSYTDTTQRNARTSIRRKSITNYYHYKTSNAIQLDREEEKRQVSTLMTVIGPEARKVYSNFQWDDLDNKYQVDSVFGISDHKVCERLLREPKLTLEKIDALCRASKATQQQLKAMSTDALTRIVTRRRGNERHKKPGQKSDSSALRNVVPKRFHASKFPIPSHDTHDCGNCGRKHPADKSKCPAHGQTCRNCGKRALPSCAAPAGMHRISFTK